MEPDMAIGIIIGFGFGVALAAGIFYALYLQVSTEIFGHITELKKTLGWLGVKIHDLANDETKE
jgi:hypothetical protein